MRGKKRKESGACPVNPMGEAESALALVFRCLNSGKALVDTVKSAVDFLKPIFHSGEASFQAAQVPLQVEV